MPKDLPVAESDIATIAPAATEVGALALPTLNPEAYAAAVYEPFASKLKTAIDSVQTIDYDIKTTAGMVVAVKARATFRDLRIDADKEREVRKAPILKIGKLLQSGYVGIEERAKPLELMFDADIEAEITRKAEVKAEAGRFEAARAAAIRAKIAEISSLPAKHVRATAAELNDALRELATREIMKEEFAEQTDDARSAVDTAAAELIALRDAATASEAAALAAEEARKAEAVRIEQERATLAAQRAENERVANEQAATAKRLADQEATQALAAKQLADKAAANLKADRDAQELVMRLEREKAEKEQAERDRVAADLKRQLDEQQAAIAAERKALDDERAAAIKLNADHAEALDMNAVFDAAIARAAIEPEKFTSEADLARCNGMVGSLLTDARVQASLAAYADAGMDEDLTDDEIIEAVMEATGLGWHDAIARIEQIDLARARAKVAT